MKQQWNDWNATPDLAVQGLTSPHVSTCLAENYRRSLCWQRICQVVSSVDEELWTWNYQPVKINLSNWVLPCRPAMAAHTDPSWTDFEHKLPLTATNAVTAQDPLYCPPLIHAPLACFSGWEGRTAPRRLGASGLTRTLCPAAPRCRRGGARAGAAL